jgi:hypothetical protein
VVLCYDVPAFALDRWRVIDCCQVLDGPFDVRVCVDPERSRLWHEYCAFRDRFNERRRDLEEVLARHRGHLREECRIELR